MKQVMSMFTALLVISCFSVNPVAAEKSKLSGYLGVHIQDVSSALKKQLGISGGALIKEVEENSPADKAGLEEDDIILEVDSSKIRKPSTLSRVIRRKKPNSKARLVFLRNGKKQSVDVTIGESKKSNIAQHFNTALAEKTP